MLVMCPNCNRQAEIAGAGPDEVVSCPHCGKAMRLPEEAPPPAESQSAPASPARPSPSPAPAGAGADGVVAPQRFAGGMISPTAMRCPHCGEEVAEGAPRCPHCDTWFDEAARREDRREGPDWERRTAVGWWTGFWNTTRGVLVDPIRTFDRIRLTGYGEAIRYSLLCNYVGIVAALFWQGLLQGIPLLIQLSSGNLPSGQLAVFGIIAAVFLGLMLVGPLIATAMAFVSAAMYHLGLKIMKGVSQPYEATYRTVAYASGAPQLLLLVPFCGSYVAGIWAMVVTIIGLSRVHRTEWWRVLLGALIVWSIIGTAMLLVVAAVVGVVIALSA